MIGAEWTPMTAFAVVGVTPPPSSRQSEGRKIPGLDCVRLPLV